MQKQCAGCGRCLDPEFFPYTMNARTNKRFAKRECRMCENRNARTLRYLKKFFHPIDSRCEICSRTDKQLFLDHDHNKTGISAYRGFLCRRCNQGCASFTIPELQNTIRYLEKAEARSRELCDCEFSDSSCLSNGSTAARSSRATPETL